MQQPASEHGLIMSQRHEPAGSESMENVQNIKQGSSGSEDDDEYVNNKRGWLMAVATLFVGMAFQAAIQLPAWFPNDWPQAFISYSFHKDNVFRVAAPTTSSMIISSAPSPISPDHHATSSSLTKSQARGIRWYILFNTATFTIALAFLITLVAVGRSLASHSMRLMNLILFTLIFSTSFTFVLAISHDWKVIRWMLGILVFLGSYTLFICLVWPKILKKKKKSRRDA